MNKRFATLIAGGLTALALTGVTAGTANAAQHRFQSPEFRDAETARSWIPDLEAACRKYGTVTDNFVEFYWARNPQVYVGVVLCEIK